MIQYDFVEARFLVILSNFQTDSQLYIIYTFDQLFLWIVSNNDHIWPDIKWFWVIFEPTPTLPIFTFGQLCMRIGANNDYMILKNGIEHLKSKLGSYSK